MILIDTHVAIWLALDPASISHEARLSIDAARRDASGIAICDISLLEISALVEKGRIRFDLGLDAALGEIQSRFVVLPISARACALVAGFPANYPKDPADRIIGATAIAEGIPLVTADRAIRRSAAVRTIW